MSEVTDEALMADLRAGDQSALAVLVKRYQNDLFRFCLHYLRDVERAKELTQETYIRVYIARDRFDPARQFRPWVLRIARNLCLNELKRKKSVPMDSLDDYASSSRNALGEVLKSSADGPDGQLMAAERHETLEQILNTLEAEAREVVVLRYFERLSAREIAEILGSTEGAIRTRLHRILKSLRQNFERVRDDL